MTPSETRGGTRAAPRHRRLQLWLNDRRIAVIACCRTRRAFRRHRLTPAARQQLEAVRRRTP